MTAAIEPRARLAALTGIRGVAAWFIVLFHIRTGARTQLPEALLAILDKGYLAVDLFFMLSGFVLWLNYAERLRGHGIAGVPAFLARRLARIWPLHIFILGLTVMLALAQSVAGDINPHHYRWSELPLHVLLIQNWGFTHSLTWNDPAWSISCEFAAYLLFPLLALTVNWRQISSRALVLLLPLLALSLHFAMASNGASSLGTDVPRFGLVRALIEFLMGTMLCALWWRWRGQPRAALAGAIAAVAILAPAALAGLVAETFAVPLIFASLLLAVALTAASPANLLGWRPVHYLGEISYATYLAHFLLYILFKIAFVDDAANVPLPSLALFLVIVLVASVALHHGIERPAQRALNRAIDGWHWRTPASAESA